MLKFRVGQTQIALSLKNGHSIANERLKRIELAPGYYAQGKHSVNIADLARALVHEVHVLLLLP